MGAGRIRVDTDLVTERSRRRARHARSGRGGTGPGSGSDPGTCGAGHGALTVVFGSSVAGTPVMEAAPLAALDLPLKALVWDDGGETKVVYAGPAELAARHGLSDELAARFAGIDAVTDAAIAG